jgi:hypothetical protein
MITMDNIETTRNYDAIRDMYNILNVLKEYDAKMYVSNHNLACTSNFCAEILIEDFYRIEIEFHGNNRYSFYLHHPCYLQRCVSPSLKVAEELKKFIQSCEAAWYDELYKKLNTSTSFSKADMEKTLKFYMKKLHDVTSRSISSNDVIELDEYIKSIYELSKRIVRTNDHLQCYRED